MVRKNSGLDLVQTDRIALLLGLTTHLTVSQFGQSAVLGVPGLPFRRASPAGLMAPAPSSVAREDGYQNHHVRTQRDHVEAAHTGA
jgi:hypothetical protein